MAAEVENDVTQIHNLERESNGFESSTEEILAKEEAIDAANSDDERMAPEGDSKQQAEEEISEPESSPELQASTGGDTRRSSVEGSSIDTSGDTRRTSGEGLPIDTGDDARRETGEGSLIDTSDDIRRETGEGSLIDTSDDTRRETGEESPLHTPGGTPIAKHVQFEEAAAPEDPEDPEDPQPVGTIEERLSENGYDESTAAAAAGDSVEPGSRAADAEQNDDGGDVTDVAIQPVASSVVMAAASGNGSPAAITDDRAADSKSKSKPTDGRSAAIGLSGSGSDDVRCKWGCCCSIGWIMVGLVSIVCGVMLVVYLRQFWKATNNPKESLLLYFGIGACIFGGLMLLVGLSFWTCACVYWNVSDCTRGKGHNDDKDPEMSTKVKHNLGNKVYYVNSSETDQKNDSTAPVTDETFLV